ncbi:hypothetical protein [Paractinoplanes lichenicola]|uniref:Uncharacterized protein n=1 Tax=Paractinoplanes lichenicola TaxID=2802976 RepID=A0ABS1VEE4_9ACTN|nr:hypothetical protein [Actinoplanes lichenicola]MBL7253060.1 hypothetical protein [Actinoplanes lichenicola]
MTGPLAVAVANGDYATLAKLVRAVPDATSLIGLLEDQHGFGGVVLADMRRGALLDEIDSVLPKRAMPGATLILLWTGHGEIGPDGRLKLLVRTTDTADDEIATAGKLGEWATRTGARQVLVVVDTCYSGGGVVDAVAMADAVLAGRADTEWAWFGVVAASRGDEPARSGALARDLTRLLTHGPTSDELRIRWNAYREQIRGDDLIDALLKDWSEPRHSPQPAAIGNAWPMFRNPLHRPRATHVVVEHLLQAARSSSTTDNFFTGRERILTRVVAWLCRGTPGLYVVTGPPGSGKSAILGRIVSLSVPDERNRLGPLAAELDPGEHSVDAHLHARGLDVKSAVETLVRQLGLPPEAGVYDLLALAARRRADGEPLTVAIDGLDEAGDLECRNIAVQVVEPLAREALVLIGSREISGGVGEPGLLALLGAPAETVNLGQWVEETMHDVRRYVVRRLHEISASMDPAQVADEILRTARAADPAREGPFLLARLITSQLRAVPVDTSGRDWQTQLAGSVEAALEADLERTVLTVNGREHPTAARELLRALCCAHGNGLPADDVWPAIVTALSPTGVRYTRDDVYALLLALGRHIVVGTTRGQAVYRVAHQRLIDHLLPTLGKGVGRALPPTMAWPVAEAVAGLYQQLLDEGQEPDRHAYLWLYAWRHLADADLPGLALLRTFVDRDRDAFLPDLSMAIDLVANRSFLASRSDAVSLHEESVQLHRDLGDRIDLAASLFELATVRAVAGDTEGAEDAAAEASELARQAHDDPAGRRVLAGSLSALALAQLRSGHPAAAERSVVEAITLIETPDSDRPEHVNVAALSNACVILAMAAMLQGDLDQADEVSRRAVDVLDKLAESNELVESGRYDFLLLDALVVRARLELVRILDTPADGASTTPGSTAAERIAKYYRRNGPTGSIADIVIAEGMRMLALGIWFATTYRGARPGPFSTSELLDSAIGLVMPFAEGSLDAAVVLAGCLTQRVRLATSPNLARALEDLELAERHLRRFEVSNPLVALQLGDTMNEQVKTGLSAGVADLPTLIERQTEAAKMLNLNLTVARVPRIIALESLAQLHNMAGQPDESVAVRELATATRREMLDGSEQATIGLAATLSDVAAVISATRPLEAITYIAEALDLLEPFRNASPTVISLRGLLELNRSIAQVGIDLLADARGSVERALELLDTDDLPIMPAIRALALAHAASLDLKDHHAELALRRIRRAVEVFDDPMVEPDSPSRIPLMRIILGQALRETGSEAEGLEQLNAGINALRDQLSDNDLSVMLLAIGLNTAGAAVWDKVLADLGDQPVVAAMLLARRIRPPAEAALTVRDVRAALTATDSDPTARRGVHYLARQQRARDPKSFETAWTATGDKIPEWIRIDPALHHLVVAWWNQPTWAQSRTYLLEKPELLAPATDMLLEELRSVGLDDDTVDLHLELRADAAARGVEAAYAPLLSAALVDEWMSADDSEAFLAEHYDELLGPGVAAAVAGRAAAGDPGSKAAEAVLVLTRRADQSVAFRVLEDAEYGVTLLQPAWRSVDVERLAAIATLCLHTSSAADPNGRLATVALAISRAILGDPDEAAELVSSALAEVTDADERGRLIAAVSDALAFQPESQDSLFRLLQATRPAADQ